MGGNGPCRFTPEGSWGVATGEAQRNPWEVADAIAAPEGRRCVHHLNLRRLNAATSAAESSNHSPFRRLSANLLCQ